MSDVVRITFLPGGETVTVPPGTILSDAAQQAGLQMNLPCGGRGMCGKCLVIIEQGEVSEPSEAELERLSAEQLAEGLRLACQTQAVEDVVATVPPASRVIGEKVLEADFLAGVERAPYARQHWLELSPPSLEDQRSDFRRLADALAETYAGLVAYPQALRGLSAALRDDEFRVLATCTGNRLVDVVPASAGGRCLGAAIDIGTTTVVSYIVDLGSGEILSSAALHNPQTQHGADVVSRIEFANREPKGAAVLREEAVGVANETIGVALERIGADRREVFDATVVGNTCMHHLFLGLDARYLAEAPYIPVTADPVDLQASEAGLDIYPRANVFCLPCIAGFVGADTVGVIAAERLTDREKPCLAVDIGTNGEVALWSGERLLVASCAAGPAFEGAQIEAGMRAGPGAIDHVWRDGEDITVTTIDQLPPEGICGSGLFDAMAVALETGVVDPMGRFVPDEDGLAPQIASRLQGEGNDRRIILAENSGNNGPIALTQRDVREIQLAKGAVRAAVQLLLAEVSLDVNDLEEVLIAGAFGNYIDPASALRIGLLPPVPLEKVRAVGNAAGAGAVLALISRGERGYACQVARAAEHIELMRKPEFQMTFMETMLFP